MTPSPCMLSDMISLAALGHGAHTAAPAFNATFYATAATIIPVLYLALAVQGSMFADLLTASRLTDVRVYKRIAAGHVPFRQLVTPAFVMVGAQGIAIAILFFGAIGEIEAIIALYFQSPVGKGTVPLATIFLVVLTAVRPTVAVMRAINDSLHITPQNAGASSAKPPGNAGE